MRNLQAEREWVAAPGLNETPNLSLLTAGHGHARGPRTASIATGRRVQPPERGPREREPPRGRIAAASRVNSTIMYLLAESLVGLSGSWHFMAVQPSFNNFQAVLHAVRGTTCSTSACAGRTTGTIAGPSKSRTFVHTQSSEPRRRDETMTLCCEHRISSL